MSDLSEAVREKVFTTIDLMPSALDREGHPGVYLYGERREDGTYLLHAGKEDEVESRFLVMIIGLK